jgi:hypothetical protein
MGTWTRPLFTTAPSAVIRPADLSQRTKDRLRRPLMGSNGDLLSKDYFTMGDFMIDICITARIKGYFTPELISSWKELLLLAIRSNFGLTKIECHFFCRDDSSPFYFVAYDDGTCYVHIYTNDSMNLHFADEKLPSTRNLDVEFERFVFNLHKYRVAYERTPREVHTFDKYEDSRFPFWDY